MARGGANARPRHVPQRTCVACRQGKGKREMVRLVRTSTGSARVDPTGREAGRGAYLCDQPVCWDSALRRGTLARALKLSALNQDDVQTLTTFASEHVRKPVSSLTDPPPAVFDRLTTQGAS